MQECEVYLPNTMAPECALGQKFSSTHDGAMRTTDSGGMLYHRRLILRHYFEHALTNSGAENIFLVKYDATEIDLGNALVHFIDMVMHKTDAFNNVYLKEIYFRYNSFGTSVLTNTAVTIISREYNYQALHFGQKAL